MDRMIVYQGAVPLSSDILNTNRFAMYGLARLAESIIGTATVASGLACTPTTPSASLNVNVAYGSIYAQVAGDATPYGVLSADPNLYVKQGNINPITPGGTIAQTFTITPPSTAGQSQNYLIEAAYADVDGVPVTLLYLNTSNPPSSYAQPWAGPNNTGNANNTDRQGVCVLTLKAGTPAATGTQTTPSVDAGNIGLWVITVAQGATTIISGNIVQYASSSFITSITAQGSAAAYREVLQQVAPYGAPPAIVNFVGDIPMIQMSKANTPGVWFLQAITSKININLPLRIRFYYTTDIPGGNVCIQVGYQTFTSGSFTPASYTSNVEAMPAAGVAQNALTYQTATAIIPAGALALNAIIAVLITRQGANGLDTNTGNLNIAQINVEQ